MYIINSCLITTNTIIPPINKTTYSIIINNLVYNIDATDSSRKQMNNLTTITTLPDVYKINFTLSSTPNLKYFNLFEGLQEIRLESSLSNLPISLTIPSSVNQCELRNIKFKDLIF